MQDWRQIRSFFSSFLCKTQGKTVKGRHDDGEA